MFIDCSFLRQSRQGDEAVRVQANGKPTVSNVALMSRAVSMALAFGVIGFSGGFFGPLYLLDNPGIGPVTGFFVAPIGMLVGLGAAIHASSTAHTNRQYWRRMLLIALLFATTTIAVVVLQ